MDLKLIYALLSSLIQIRETDNYRLPTLLDIKKYTKIFFYILFVLEISGFKLLKFCYHILSTKILFNTTE